MCVCTCVCFVYARNLTQHTTLCGREKSIDEQPRWLRAVAKAKPPNNSPPLGTREQCLLPSKHWAREQKATSNHRSAVQQRRKYRTHITILAKWGGVRGEVGSTLLLLLLLLRSTQSRDLTGPRDAFRVSGNTGVQGGTAMRPLGVVWGLARVVWVRTFWASARRGTHTHTHAADTELRDRELSL